MEWGDGESYKKRGLRKNAATGIDTRDSALGVALDGCRCRQTSVGGERRGEARDLHGPCRDRDGRAREIPPDGQPRQEELLRLLSSRGEVTVRPEDLLRYRIDLAPRLEQLPVT